MTVIEFEKDLVKKKHIDESLEGIERSREYLIQSLNNCGSKYSYNRNDIEQIYKNYNDMKELLDELISNVQENNSFNKQKILNAFNIMLNTNIVNRFLIDKK